MRYILINMVANVNAFDKNFKTCLIFGNVCLANFCLPQCMNRSFRDRDSSMGDLKNGVPNFQNVWLSNICSQAQDYFLSNLFYFHLVPTLCVGTQPGRFASPASECLLQAGRTAGDSVPLSEPSGSSQAGRQLTGREASEPHSHAKHGKENKGNYE